MFLAQWIRSPRPRISLAVAVVDPEKMGREFLKLSRRLLLARISGLRRVERACNKAVLTDTKRIADAHPSSLARSLSLKRANANAKAKAKAKCKAFHRPHDSKSGKQDIIKRYALLQEDDIRTSQLRSASSSSYMGVKKELKKSSVSRKCPENELKKWKRRSRGRLEATSLSATIPDDVRASSGVKNSVALVVYSSDPYLDFRDSMMQMMIEYSQRMSYSESEMEELLYCYFRLNSPQHYFSIKEAFLDIWRDSASG